MSRWISLTVLILFSSMGFSVSNEELRALMDKKTATVADAMVLVGSIDNADFGRDNIRVKDNKRLAALKQDGNLFAGELAIVLIENKKCPGGLFYMLTGFGRYAAQSLVHQGFYPAEYAWNRAISGKELIEVVAAVKDKIKPEKEEK